MAATKTLPRTVAANVTRLAAEHGAQIEVHHEHTTLTVVIPFTPGDADAYRSAERACREILSEASMVYPGTVWGTDSASVGGHAGMTQGYCRLSKSGVAKRELTAIAKLVRA